MVFLLVWAALLSQYLLLILAVPVMLVTSAYIVTATAYLTGLRTNSALFDTEVLIKFQALALLPMTCMTILSFFLGVKFLISVAVLALVCFILIMGTQVLYKGIDTKWGDESFY